MSIRIDRKQVKRVSMKIESIGKRSENLAPAWKSVGSYFAMANRRQFATHGAYYGTPWKPLKPEYLQWKIRNGYSRRTLVQTGAMRVTFTSRPMAIEKYYKKSAEFGSNHPFARFHQDGTHRNGKRAIPPRKIMVKNKQVVSAVKSIIADYVADGRVSGVKRYI